MNRIKELRIAKKIKQVDFCKQIGVTQGALSGWENEKYEPDIKAIHKMAEIFEVTIDYLLGREEQKEKPLENEELSNQDIEFIEDLNSLTAEQQEMVRKFVRSLKS